MNQKRKSGILLHITSLPSEYGIGDLGPSAYRFIDFLYEAKQCYWQVLPINPTDLINAHSPYSSSSAFAGNNLFISPELLLDEGLISKKDVTEKPHFSVEKVDYEPVAAYKTHLLDLAYVRFIQDRRLFSSHEKEFNKFITENVIWLNDYALFVTIKEQCGSIIWTDWPENLRKREAKALADFTQTHISEINRIKFLEYLFFKQWDQLRNYCGTKDIQLIGDLPIYMNFDSADVWAHPDQYKLDEQLQPVVVAGVPPDYFSDSGQRWGNPVYDWAQMQKSKFTWWVERFRQNFKLFDILRIDHFRGLVQCWEIPADEQTAVKGRLVDVPTVDLLTSLEKFFSKPLLIIAEDLGFITEDVRECLHQFNLPGMKVLLFAFNDNLKQHPYLPHNYRGRCAVYTGTHDNNTVKGWFQDEATMKERDNVHRYLSKDVSDDSICLDLIRLAFDSEAEYAIIPMQDILGLGSEARMNKPATTQGNWRWRVNPKMLSNSVVQQLSDVTISSRRNCGCA